MALINQTQEEYYLGPDGLWDSNDENYGGYQFVSISDIINNFMVVYVGEEKIISKVKRTDVAFHAQRAIQEFSFDTLPQTKSVEIECPPGLYMVMPQDYVNYTKLSWVDSSGVERLLYRTDLTSNPLPYAQDGNYQYIFDEDGEVAYPQPSETLRRWQENSEFPLSGSENGWNAWENNPDLLNLYAYGGRFGLNPEQAQANGVFYIDHTKGMIRFSSNVRGKIITMRYISDGLGTDEDMTVHKFAIDAIYKYITHAILSTRANTQEYAIQRFKKEMVAARRNAKIRLSELKSDLMAQVMRNQSKWIKS
jgi:hypothetical protein|tara:strand:+ start:497 stop:1420 length:924 start_codon:yes stop_codon:yes gene_type:complete